MATAKRTEPVTVRYSDDEIGLDASSSSTDSATPTIDKRNEINICYTRNVSDTNNVIHPETGKSIIKVISQTSWRTSKFHRDLPPTPSSYSHSLSRNSSDNDDLPSSATQAESSKRSTEEDTSLDDGDDDDDDIFYNNPLLNRLRKSSVVVSSIRRLIDANTSSSASADDAVKRFFRLRNTSTVSGGVLISTEEEEEEEEEREETTETAAGSGETNEFSANYCYYNNCLVKQKFHWIDNIENRSLWVMNKAQEIFNRVEDSELIDGPPFDDDSDRITSKETDIEDDGDVDQMVTTDSNDSVVTYEIATELYDKSITGGRATDVTGKRCQSDERFKWTKLYEKFVNSGHQCMEEIVRLCTIAKLRKHVENTNFVDAIFLIHNLVAIDNK